MTTFMLSPLAYESKLCTYELLTLNFVINSQALFHDSSFTTFDLKNKKLSMFDLKNSKVSMFDLKNSKLSMFELANST